MLESYFNASDNPADLWPSRHARRPSVPPLELLETELETVSQFMLDWHQNRTSTGRSFLMYEEDMTAERFTELAEWLGKPCTFSSAPSANGAMNVSCASDQQKLPEQLPTYQTNDGITRPITDAAPNVPPKNKLTVAYETLVNNPGGKCDMKLDIMNTFNAACVPHREMSIMRNNPPKNMMAALPTLPKFYIHEKGVFDFSDTVECFMEKLNVSKDVDSFDDTMLPDIAEHMVDWWLLKRFRDHPARVYDLRKAELHVIGTPFSTAFRAHRKLRAPLAAPPVHSSLCTYCTVRTPPQS